MLFFLNNLQIYQMSVSLQRVFHSIRFKVNKGWSTAVLLFYAHTFFTLFFFGTIFFYVAVPFTTISAIYSML